MGKGSGRRPLLISEKELVDRWDKIFSKRINEQKLNNDDMAEYELNKSTGEIQKVDNGNKSDTVEPKKIKG